MRPHVDLLKNVPLLEVGQLVCLQRADAQEGVGRRRQGRLNYVQYLPRQIFKQSRQHMVVELKGLSHEMDLAFEDVAGPGLSKRQQLDVPG
jgi:hypothetical protein